MPPLKIQEEPGHESAAGGVLAGGNPVDVVWYPLPAVAVEECRASRRGVQHLGRKAATRNRPPRTVRCQRAREQVRRAEKLGVRPLCHPPELACFCGGANARSMRKEGVGDGNDLLAQPFVRSAIPECVAHAHKRVKVAVKEAGKEKVRHGPLGWQLPAEPRLFPRVKLERRNVVEVVLERKVLPKSFGGGAEEDWHPRCCKRSCAHPGPSRAPSMEAVAKLLRKCSTHKLCCYLMPYAEQLPNQQDEPIRLGGDADDPVGHFVPRSERLVGLVHCGWLDRCHVQVKPFRVQ